MTEAVLQHKLIQANPHKLRLFADSTAAEEESRSDKDETDKQYAF
jgi:hypothetical protein